MFEQKVSVVSMACKRLSARFSIALWRGVPESVRLMRCTSVNLMSTILRPGRRPQGMANVHCWAVDRSVCAPVTVVAYRNAVGQSPLWFSAPLERGESLMRPFEIWNLVSWNCTPAMYCDIYASAAFGLS